MNAETSNGRPFPRLAYSIESAAELLGLSVSTFKRRVLPRVRTVTVGRRVLIPHRELEGWLDRSAW